MSKISNNLSTKRLRGRHRDRMARLVRGEQPFCKECLAEGYLKPWDELDHIIPLHQGGTNARSNLQGLCKEHHDKKSLSERGRRYKKTPADTQGNPTDPNHHWNKAN